MPIRPIQLIRFCVAMLACASGAAFALAPGARVDNFRLLDQNGASHELYYHSDAKAIVIMVQGNGCPIVRKAWPQLKALREQYRAQGVEFFMLNSNLQDDRASLAQEAAEFSMDLPILQDETQLIGEALGVDRTAEVFLIDTKGWKLAYRGALDDRLSYGAQKAAASKHYLRDALDAVLAGKPMADAQVEAQGCLVNFPERDKRAEHARISYAEQIAPLLTEKCVACHRPGGIGPWAMTDYEKVRGFAPMMREVIRTKRMPPWHADPHYGSFVGDRSLTNEQTKLLVHWIEAGAPRGADGPDPLATLDKTWSEWSMGKPDLIVEVPAYDVPESGVVSYQYPRAANPLGRDVWIRGIEILPGNRQVTHHVLAGIDDPNDPRRNFPGRIGELGGYAPGKNAAPYPDDTGILLRKEAGFRFQMHYTPNGKAATDVTRIGLYFHDKAPKHRLDMAMIFDPRLTIPANAKSHSESLEYTFEKDAMIYSLLPHAHWRGKAAKYTAHYPNGATEILLSVPKYDFGWQPTYFFKEPRFVPAGTKLVLDMTWDNSAQNPLNPDPNKVVHWGDQTWEEMNVGWIRYRAADEADRARAEAPDRTARAR